MKVQVKSFSTHQTAKVFALLMATASLILMIPFFFISLIAPAAVGPNGQEINSMMPFTIMILIMPIMQGVMGYIMIRIGLSVYNIFNSKIGGFEFNLEEINT